MSTAQSRITAIAKKAAPRLAGAWRFNRRKSEELISHWSGAVLTDDTTPGREIHLRRCWRNPHRVSIYGILPGLGSYAASTKSITVNPRRSGRAIAGDINRHLLPGYLDAWEQRLADLRQDENKRDIFWHKYHLLRSFCPDLRPNHSHDLQSSDRFYWTLSSGKTGCELSCGK